MFEHVTKKSIYYNSWIVYLLWYPIFIVDYS